MADNKYRDIQAEINEAVENNDYARASTLEKERNEKIDKEGLSYEKTNKYTIPNGVSGDTYNKYMTPFSTSDNVNNALKEVESGRDNLKGLVTKENIISDSVMNSINRQFRVPSAVTEADAYLSSQLEKIQSGKTSYSDQVRDMMDKIMNREKFSYDVDTDPLFQQALASAMNSGKIAMQDTIGQASALTGGYGSTYATTAGNQAYNSFIEEAYDNLPQYYQMALEAYQMEGDEMYRQFGMYSELDDKEFNRNLTAYDATYQHRNRMYDEAYNMFRDTKNDAFAMANLQLSEHGQRVSDAYNYYNAASDYANTLYGREYTQWADSINQAYQMMQMQNSDWQNQTNRDFQAAEAEKERAFTASENAKNRAASRSGEVSGDGYYKEPSQPQYEDGLKAFAEGGYAGLDIYLGSIPSDVDADAIDEYVKRMIKENPGAVYLSLEERTWTKTEDTKNGLWGIDYDDKVKDQYGTQLEISKLPVSIQRELTNLKKGETYKPKK